MFPPRRSPAAPWRIPLLVAVLVAALALYQWHARSQARPLTYRIGAVDARFGMSRESFSEAVGQAAALWKQAVPRDLFREDPEGVLEINLVYDCRQESADRLKALDLRLDDSRGGYENLKAHFETLRGEADQKGTSLAQDFAAYNSRVGVFNAQGEASRQAPLPEGSYRRLEAERLELAEAKSSLLARQLELKCLAENLKSLGMVLNGYASNHNLDLMDYRQVGDRLGPEFSEGEYVQKGGHRTITIYHFPSPDGLVRVLAHELGHARGLAHLENPQALMHRLMQTESPALAPEDIQAMKVKAGSR